MRDNRPWTFPADHAPAIAAFWQEEISRQPALFNGRILMMTEARFTGNTVRTMHVETDYAVMLYIMRSGQTDFRVRNGFALAPVISADGHVLLGQMNSHTANAGKIYAAGGTPDPKDCFGERVDLLSSVRRELAEETGLTEADVRFDERWVVIDQPPRLAFLKMVHSPLGSDALREKMLAFVAADDEQELQDIVVVRGPQDIREDLMPGFQIEFLRWFFKESQTLQG